MLEGTIALCSLKNNVGLSLLFHLRVPELTLANYTIFSTEITEVKKKYERSH